MQSGVQEQTSLILMVVSLQTKSLLMVCLNHPPVCGTCGSFLYVGRAQFFDCNIVKVMFEVSEGRIHVSFEKGPWFVKPSRLHVIEKPHPIDIMHWIGSKSNSQVVPSSHVEVVLYMREGVSTEVDDCFLCRVVSRNRQV